MDSEAIQLEALKAQELSNSLACIELGINFLLLIITIVSVICAFRAYQHQKLRAKKDAACSLAKLYADEILNQMYPITTVFKESGYAEKIKNAFPLDKIEKFNVEEAVALVGEDKFQDLVKELFTISSKTIYLGKIRSAKTITERHQLADEYTTVSKETGEVKMVNTSVLQSDFYDSITSLLNNLEWFSMNFQYNLADEAVLYQSLHQTFLSNIWSLYLNICLNNQSGSDKYYTNIVWLFNYWKTRLRTLEEEALQAKHNKEQELEQLKAECTRANQRYEQAKNSQDTQIPTYTGKPL